MKYFKFVLTAFALLMVPLPPEALAHPDVEIRIMAATERIEADPDNASLLIERGELHAEHGDWGKALRDFDLAAALDPTLSAVEFHRGRLLHSLGMSDEAEHALKKFLKHDASSQRSITQTALAHLLLGELMESANRWERAAWHYDMGIKLSPGTNPGFYIARARALVNAGAKNHDIAIKGLDDRLAAAPGIYSLLEYSVELELDRDNVDGAISRIRRLVGVYPGLPHWRLRLAELQTAQGRSEDARRTYVEARKFIDGLPERLRSKIYRSGLTADIESGLEGLE